MREVEHMKRNKTTARKGRSGTSPYVRYKKRPDQTLQAITRQNRERAERGQVRALAPMVDDR